MMRPIVFSIVAAAAFAAAAPAATQPSYDCGARLNPTERAVCDDPELAGLDRDMAAQFSRIYAGLSGDRALAFREEQTRWRRNRDACGAATGCIKANYIYRIGQFAEMTGEGRQGSPGGLTRSPATSVLADGTIERRMPDGSLVRHLPSGRVERFGPDGQRLPGHSYRSNVRPADLPPLPPPLQGWGTALESSLGVILANILTEDEFSAYLTTEAGKNDYVLIDWRLRSISILTQP
jgi:uncharacterized protein YecT (DUF1311 family)